MSEDYKIIIIKSCSNCQGKGYFLQQNIPTNELQKINENIKSLYSYPDCSMHAQCIICSGLGKINIEISLNELKELLK